MANFSTNQNALSTSAEVIGASTGRRTRVTFLNTDTGITVYFGATSAVDSSTGFPLAPGASFTFEGPSASGIIYGIAASGTPTIAVCEEYN